jgi:hypothetical protein
VLQTDRKKGSRIKNLKKMKNLVYILIMGLVAMVMGLSLTSCGDTSSDYEGMAATKKDSIPETKPEPKGEEPKDSVNWGISVKNTLLPYGEPEPTTHMWHGRQVFYASQNDSLVRTAEMPVGYELIPSEGFSYSKTGKAPIYTGQGEYSTTSPSSIGEYEKDAEGNMLRKVTYTFHCPTTEFAKTLPVSRFEGYCVLNGKQHNYKYHSVKATFLSLDSISAKEVEGEDSIFIDKTYELSYRVTFTVVGQSRAYHNYVLTARHTVRYFVRLKEKATPTPATPSNWKFIMASRVFNPNLKFNNEKECKGSFSDCIALKNETTQEWGIAIRDFNSSEWKLYKFSFDEFPGNAQINSAIWHNRWEPARLSGTSDWAYYGSASNLKMTMSEADMNGIRNFKGKETAACTPYLNWTSDYASDGSLIVVNKQGGVEFSIK